MHREQTDIIGRTFGRLTVIDFDRVDSRGDVWLLCRCGCGNYKAIRKYSLLRGDTTSCGCRRREIEDLSGLRFGRLTTLDVAGRTNGRKTLWRCRCDCGAEIVVVSDSLKSGHTKSCGCLHSDIMREISTTHGHAGERIHSIWRGMKDRCNNPNRRMYKDYGERGIRVCPEWEEDFQEFYNWSMDNGYADDLTVDRINNDEGYSPNNCRWATNKEQANNKRSCRYITFNGVTHNIAEWAKLFDMPQDRLRQRINRGDMRDFEEYFK